MVLKNLTAHTIKITTATQTREFVPEGEARLVSTYTPTPGIYVDGIHIPCKIRVIRTEGLPEATPNIRYIVSTLVAAANSHRDDLLTPGDLIRTVTGDIVGTQCLIKPEIPDNYENYHA